MEPCYVASNRHMDAMAIAWLFANDFIFFNPNEIAWDGSRHAMTGIQLNAEKVGEIPEFMENPQMYVNGIADFLQTLEDDESLVVPRSKIHPALHGAIREGDLTGLTLFNLQACGRAFAFVTEEGFESAQSIAQGTYIVSVDTRLTCGIPNFYGLLRRLIHRMRAYNGLEEIPFAMACVGTRNFDADAYLGQLDTAIAGAVSEAVHRDVGLAEPWSQEEIEAFVTAMSGEHREESDLDEPAGIALGEEASESEEDENTGAPSDSVSEAAGVPIPEESADEKPDKSTPESMNLEYEAAGELADEGEPGESVIQKSERLLSEALVGRVSADDFSKMVSLLALPYTGDSKLNAFTAAQRSYLEAHGDPGDDECTLVGARGIAKLCNQAVPKLEQIVDAFYTQVAAGASASELRTMFNSIEQFNETVFPTPDLFFEDDALLVEQAGIFAPTPELLAVRERLEQIRHPKRPENAQALEPAEAIQPEAAKPALDPSAPNDSEPHTADNPSNPLPASTAEPVAEQPVAPKPEPIEPEPPFPTVTGPTPTRPTRDAAHEAPVRPAPRPAAETPATQSPDCLAKGGARILLLLQLCARLLVAAAIFILLAKSTDLTPETAITLVVAAVLLVALSELLGLGARRLNRG